MLFAVIAQLKFTLSYLVPGGWQIVMLAVSTVLAGATSFFRLAIDPIHGTEWPFVLNCLFWLLVANAIMGLVWTCRQVFGRKPSISEVLSGLTSTKTFNDYKEEQRLRDRGLEEQISKIRHDTDERFNRDLVHYENVFKEIFRRADERDAMMMEMGREMSRMQERTESHIRKMEQADTRFDVLRREVSETVGALRAARERLERQE